MDLLILIYGGVNGACCDDNWFVVGYRGGWYGYIGGISLPFFCLCTMLLVWYNYVKVNSYDEGHVLYLYKDVVEIGW